ncbi:MAG: hypothetical protein LBT78_11240, partial [Tannerella sp.]|nr:hypothetical protein [Tannerella sp.]
MTTPQLPPGWEWKRLGDICEEDKIIVDGRSSDLPFLGLEMVESETGKIDWDAQTVEGASTCFYFDVCCLNRSFSGGSGNRTEERKSILADVTEADFEKDLAALQKNPLMHHK